MFAFASYHFVISVKYAVTWFMFLMFVDKFCQHFFMNTVNSNNKKDSYKKIEASLLFK